MKRIVMGFAALSILAASSAFAMDHAKTADQAAATQATGMTDDAKMKARAKHRRMKMRQQQEMSLPAGQPQNGFRNQPVMQH